MLEQTGLYWRTVRHLQPRQVAARLLTHVPRPHPSTTGSPQRRETVGIVRTPVERAPLLSAPDTFTFLNVARSLGDVGWQAVSMPRLWAYNLHYFDDLVAEGARDRRVLHVDLIRRWIAGNPVGSRPGWEPYPTSRRIANWIRVSLAGLDLDGQAADSLALQVRWLERRLEHHLGANHLLANAVALVLAGLFFEGVERDRWRERGGRLLAQELDRQILTDGGHVERSPMYQAIVLEDVLGLVDAARAYGCEDQPAFADLPRIASEMLAWLLAMTHPDGEIAFFNDAAFGVAAAPGCLTGYAARLGIVPKAAADGAVRALDASGYVRAELDDAVAFLDVAPVGPDHQPGHAHADTLSFELSVAAERVVVNGGTSTYERDAVRARERSTASHSTVEIGGVDSSEVWAAFRVARRARPFDVTVDGTGLPACVSAAHDGYRRLKGAPVHRRTWRLDRRNMVVADQILGPFAGAMARFHLHPDVSVSLGHDGVSAQLTLASGRTVACSSTTPVQIEQSSWSPGFGKTLATRCLTVRFDSPVLETAFAW